MHPNLKPKIVSIGKQSVNQIVFNPQGKGFYVLANNGLRILRYDLKKIEEVVTLKDPIMKLDVSSDGGQIIGLDKHGYLHIWDDLSFHESLFKVSNYSGQPDFIYVNENIISRPLKS